MKEILLLNCYSAKNSGDGLLVDLAIEKIHEKHGKDINVTIVCSDVASFEKKYNCIENEYSNNTSAYNVLFLLMKAFLFLITGKYYSKHYKSLLNADIVYSVGGGYLRFGSILESIKTTCVHCTQIFWASSNLSIKHVFLPQSIGPFRYTNRFFMRKLLRDVDEIFVRDDRTVNELNEFGISSYRAKDMAAKKLIEDLALKSATNLLEKNTDKKRCIFILRDLRRGDAINLKMLDKIKEISNSFDEVIYAIQSQVNSNNDLDFYRKYGIDAKLSVKQALHDYPGALVISVRLHGAIESLISGFKTIHLTYERKGFGAYQDLNLAGLVHNVYNFDVINIVNNINYLNSISEQDFFNLMRK